MRLVEMICREAVSATVRLAGEPWAVLFDKQRVARRSVLLGFDLSNYTDADFDAVNEYLAPYEAAAAALPRGRSALRWCYHGRSTLFEFGRILNAPYEDVVARVDITSAIRLMSDYVGGSVAVVSRDELGRVVRQAERNIYLPQPNWLVLSGGAFIDVCKLESISYGRRWQRIAWRTIYSPNGSAVKDDGSVALEGIGDRTRVTIRGLQQFTLPPLWAFAEPWLPGVLKDTLTEESYRRFFTATLDNFEARFEGREFEIGRDPVEAEPMLGPSRLSRMMRAVPKEAQYLDMDGFRHFAGAAAEARREGGEATG